MAEKLGTTETEEKAKKKLEEEAMEGKVKTEEELKPWEQHSAVICIPRFDYNAPSSLLNHSHSGFLITCPIKREKSATKEAMPVLEKYIRSSSSLSAEVSKNLDANMSAKRRRICGSIEGELGNNLEGKDAASDCGDSGTMPRTKHVAHHSKRTRSAQREVGESSGQSESDPRFTSAENEEWYVERAERGFIIEKTITPEVESVYGVVAHFDIIGWSGILDLPYYYYPELVREFYANMEEKKSFDNLYLRSTVRGVEIELRRGNLSTMFGLSSNGTSIDLTKGFTPPSDWSYEEAVHRIGGVFQRFRSSGDNVVLASSLTPQRRLIQSLFTANVIPKSSGKNEMRKSDVYFLDKMIEGPQTAPGGGIPLATILISHMRTFARYQKGTFLFPYPRILSAIIEHYGVDVSKVAKKTIPSSCSLTMGNVKSILGIPSPNEEQAVGEEEQGSERYEGGQEQMEAKEPHHGRQEVGGIVIVQQQMETIIGILQDLSGRVARIERHICRSPTPPPP